MGNLDYFIKGIKKDILYLACIATILVGCGTATPQSSTDTVSATLSVRSCSGEGRARRCDYKITLINNTDGPVTIEHSGRLFYNGSMVYTGQFSSNGWNDLNPDYDIPSGGRYVDNHWVQGIFTSVGQRYQGTDDDGDEFYINLRTELRRGSSDTSEAKPGWPYFNPRSPTESPKVEPTRAEN